MKKQSFRLNAHINTLCVTAFISVALNVIVGDAHAEGVNSDAAQASAPLAQAPGMPASGQSGLPQGVVARVNDIDIPEAQLEDALRASRQPDTPQVRQAIRQNLVVREIFRQNAEKQHYDAKPEVQQAMYAAKVNAETQLYLKDNIHPEPVTDAQVKARYDEIVALLGKEEYKPSIISVTDDATAGAVLKQLKAGAAFDVLARQYSIAPSKAAGGAMDWVSFKTPAAEGKTQGMPLPVAQALTQLPVGGVTSTPIAVGNVRVIVRLEAKRPTQVPGYDQAKDTIHQQMQILALQKASAQFVSALLKGASIQQ